MQREHPPLDKHNNTYPAEVIATSEKIILFSKINESWTQVGEGRLQLQLESNRVYTFRILNDKKERDEAENEELETWKIDVKLPFVLTKEGTFLRFSTDKVK